MSISAVSGATATSSDDVIWRLDPSLTVAQLVTEDYRAAGNTGALTLIENAGGAPYQKVLDYTHASGGSDSWTIYTLKDPITGSDLIMPADSDGYMRYTIECRQGPRSSGGVVYGANIIPGIFFYYQNENRNVRIFRSASDGLPGVNNNESLDGNLDSFQASLGANTVGPNTDRGGFSSIDVKARPPSAGVRPAGNFTVRGVDAPPVNRNFSVGWTASGGTPPNSQAAWNVAWETGGPIKIAIGFFEASAGAGKSYISDLVVKRHPLSNA